MNEIVFYLIVGNIFLCMIGVFMLSRTLYGMMKGPFPSQLEIRFILYILISDLLWAILKIISGVLHLTLSVQVELQMI
jgi:hypothetical protein